MSERGDNFPTLVVALDDLRGDNHPAEATIDLDELEEEAPPAEDKLDRIVRLARLQMTQERAVLRAEQALEAAKNALRTTCEVDLPNALSDAGIGGLPLDNGWRVEVDRRTFAGIPKGGEQDAFAHLREVGGDPIIKYGLSVELRKGDRKLTDAVRSYLRRRGIVFKVRESVHPQTLQKFVRDADRDGRPVNDALLGVHRVSVSRLIPPKDEVF